MTPWFDIRCTACPNRDEVQRDALAFDEDAGRCTAGAGECPGRMVRAITAPAIGKGSSGEPIRPAT